MADVKTDGKQDDLRGTLPAGTRLRNYELISVLGQGGFGITYYARDTTLGREVAIKEYLPTSLALREETMVVPRSTLLAEDFVWGRDRFVEEARILASLEGAPAVVRVYDFMEANGTAYMIMGLVRGETLEERLRREDRLSPAVVGRLLGRLLDGLEAVHRTGFLHRDIKPANVILDSSNNPTLIDFGASRASMAGRTAAMTAIFTPRYAAAEQLASERQGPWTDIYSLSATIYHAIAGNPPPSSLERALDDSYVPLGRLRPQGYSPNLLHGIDAGLTVRPRERPQSIAEWREVLSGRETAAADATIFVRSKPATATASDTAAAAQPAAARRARPAAPPGAEPSVAPPTAASPSQSPHGASPAPPDGTKPHAGTAKRAGLAMAAAALVLVLGIAGYSVHLWTRSPSSDHSSGTTAAAPAEAASAHRDAEARADAEAKARAAAEAQAKAETDARQKAELEARQKADAEARQKAAAATAQAEAEAKAKADAEARRKADADAKAKADAEAKARADAEAKAKADADAKRKVEADLTAQKAAAEVAEAALRLPAADRLRLQVALTSLGFDTHGADGAFGPRTREMIQSWQQARQHPATGFLTAAEQQALLSEAAPALAKYDEDQRKAAEAAARARATGAGPSPAPRSSGVACQDASGRRLEFPNATSCPYGLMPVR